MPISVNSYLKYYPSFLLSDLSLTLDSYKQGTNMGVSIYYSATKKTPFNFEEKNTFETMVNQLNQAFPYKEDAETLYFYEEPSDQFLLQGSTKLPLDDESILLESIDYWLDCLSQLTLAFSTAHWSVSIEDSEATWVDDHWEM